MAELLLGIDVGTFSSKGVLADLAGKVVASAVVEHDMEVPRSGWAEQDADVVWWGDVVQLCRRLLTGPHSGADVVGVGLSAIGPCLLPLDAHDRPLRKGILYGVDARATDEIAHLEQSLGEETIFQFSGMALSSQAIGPKILWLQRHEPEVWKQAAHLTTASSYLILRLTGEKVIDRHTASHYMPLVDLKTLDWSDRFADQLVDLAKLPRMGWSDEIAGQVSAVGAQETGLKVGTPVAVGAVDALSEGISVGVVEPGDLMIMYGSTAFFILVQPAPTPDRRMWTVAGAFAGQYNLAAGMATTGTLTRWFRDELAKDLPKDQAYAQLFAAAAGIAPGADGLLTLPYFSGERTPINDPKARGIVAGLTLTHTRSHLFRSALEGVAFGIRHNVETFQHFGSPVRRIVAVGGGAQSDTWLQIVSDAVGLPQHVPALTIGASFGDAFLAGLAAGRLQRTDLNQWVKPGRLIEPRPAVKQIYDAIYPDYLDLYHQTRALMHRR